MSATELPAISLDEPFDLPGGARALFTTRAAGNLSLAAGAGHEQGLTRRDALCRALSLDWLCAAPQVHGTRVQRIESLRARGGQPLVEPADGHATALPGVGAMVLAADCVPVVLAAPGAVAAVHAGWRGLAGGVLAEGVEALRELAAAPGLPVAVVGPCAGACCYEVGAEVLARFAPGASEPAWTPADAPAPARTAAAADAGGREQKAKLDLRALARERLHLAGVDRVIDLDVCTICDERMFSHRREAAAAGRQAAIAWLP